MEVVVMLEKREAGTSVRSVWLWTVKISFQRNSCLLFLVKDKNKKIYNLTQFLVLTSDLAFSTF